VIRSAGASESGELCFPDSRQDPDTKKAGRHQPSGFFPTGQQSNKN